MKDLITTLILFILITLSLSAQIRLDVEGDAKIQGKLDLKSGTNIIIGTNAGIATTGNFNTIFGIDAGRTNTTGAQNTFLGYSAGKANTTANNNTFIGISSGLSNTTGAQNTFMGTSSGQANTTASFNTFIGTSAGIANTTGVNNTFLGASAGNKNTTAQSNVFIGVSAGKNCTVHGDGGAVTSSSSNTMIGSDAGTNTTLGTQNVFLGANSGLGNTDGDGNVFLGTGAGETASNGSFQTFVGHNVNALVGVSAENSFAIGQNTVVTAPNAGILGNVSTQKVGSSVNWSSISDGRFKKKIKEDVKGLDFILQLRPVTYQIQAEKLYNFTKNDQAATARSSNSQMPLVNETSAILKKALAEKSKITYSGFIAQEVEKAAKKSGFNFSGVVQPNNEKDPYGIRYAEFTVPLVKATQEQQTIIEDLKLENQEQQQELKKQRAELRQLQKEMQEYKALLEKLIANKTTNPQAGNQTLILERKASLSQNQPNPFQQQTIVNYFIPKNVQSAILKVMTVDGKVIGNINIDGKGEGQTTIETATYPSGIYYYALVLDGQVFETKRMVLAHK